MASVNFLGTLPAKVDTRSRNDDQKEEAKEKQSVTEWNVTESFECSTIPDDLGRRRRSLNKMNKKENEK